MSKKVLHVLGSMDNGGGIQSLIMSVFRTISPDIHFDFLLYNSYGRTAYFEREIKDAGSSVFYVHSRGESIVKNYKEIRTFFREKSSEYDAVHFHISSATYILPIRFAFKFGVPIRIVHCHNSNMRGDRLGTSFHMILHKLHKPKIKKYANVYLSCSDAASDWLYEESIRNKAEVVRNGINSEKFAFSQNARDRIRAELGIKNGEFLIGNVGRFHAQKNHLFLLDIFDIVHRSRHNTKLILVGDGDDRTMIEDKINALSLNDAVILAGLRSDVSNLLQGMDMFLFPSLYEGLGIVLVEAQCSGLKCFASNRVIPNEAKVTNLLDFINLEDGPDLWAKKIVAYIDGVKVDRKSHIEEITENGYDIHTTAGRLAEIYSSTSL